MLVPDIDNNLAGKCQGLLKGQEIEQFSFAEVGDTIEIYTKDKYICICLVDGELDLEIRSMNNE